MAVAQMTRFSGGSAEEMIATAKKSKALWMKHGAETVLFSRIHTGMWTGQWLFTARCADWAAFGKAQEGLAKDPEFQKLLTQAMSMAKLEARTVLVGIDI